MNLSTDLSCIDPPKIKRIAYFAVKIGDQSRKAFIDAFEANFEKHEVGQFNKCFLLAFDGAGVYRVHSEIETNSLITHISEPLEITVPPSNPGFNCNEGVGTINS